MKLTRVQGDLLEEFKNNNVEHIAHCCNCQGVMGSGIALSIKQDLSGAYLSYKQYESAHGLTLGTVSTWSGIWNLHAQNLYKSAGAVSERFVDYEALAQCLERVRGNIPNDTKIGFPFKMGADRAGGDWNVIEAIIVSVFKDTDVEVVIVEFNGTRNA